MGSSKETETSTDGNGKPPPPPTKRGEDSGRQQNEEGFSTSGTDPFQSKNAPDGHPKTEDNDAGADVAEGDETGAEKAQSEGVVVHSRQGKQSSEEESVEDESTTLPAVDSGELEDLDPEMRRRIVKNPTRKESYKAAAEFYRESLSENTWNAYQNAWNDFLDFCEQEGDQPLPAAPETVAFYLGHLAVKPDPGSGEAGEDGLAVSTIEVRLHAISYFHSEAGAGDPTKDRKVKKVMRGIRRRKKDGEGASPLLATQIRKIIDALPKKKEVYIENKLDRVEGTPSDPLTSGEKRHLNLLIRRNRAIILLGFAGAFRRSEIAGLRYEDVEHYPEQGLRVTIPKSKTDQTGTGQTVHIQKLEGDYDPVEAFLKWKASAEDLGSGPVFRGVTRGGNLRTSSIAGEAINRIVKEGIDLAGIPDPEAYSAHSLRAGHATQATLNGVPAESTMNTTRHESRNQFAGYVRNDEEAFQSSTSGSVGLEDLSDQ